MKTVTFTAAGLQRFDLCIVGAGPAGLALALEYAKSGRTVLIVEMGDERPSRATAAFLEANIASDVPHVPVEESVVPALGGTSWRWGGRVVPLDPEDFSDPNNSARPGWPISYADYAAWIAQASAFLGCTAHFSDAPPQAWQTITGVAADRVEQLGPLDDVAALNREALRQADGIHLLYGAVVTGLEWDASSGDQRTVIGPQIVQRAAPSAAPVTVRADFTVLCNSGLEATRLLLIEQRKQSDLFGGPNSKLGTHYAGHITGSVADIQFQGARDHTLFEYQQLPTCGLARRRLTLDPPTATNIAFWMANPAMGNPAHGAASLSVRQLAKMASGRHRTSGTAMDKGGVVGHARNVVRDPIGALAGASRSIAKRLQPQKRPYERLVRSRSRTYRLHYHAGQFACRQSRVVLSNNADPAGRPRLEIQYKVSDADIQVILDAHMRLQQGLNASMVARLEFRQNKEQTLDAIRRQARDGYHQISTTRMHRSASEGVVDGDCKVHGTTNLYIAAASIFPVAGQANPTLSVVMFAQRLGHHLCALTPRI